MLRRQGSHGWQWRRVPGANGGVKKKKRRAQQRKGCARTFVFTCNRCANAASGLATVYVACSGVPRASKGDCYQQRTVTVATCTPVGRFGGAANDDVTMQDSTYQGVRRAPGVFRCR